MMIVILEIPNSRETPFDPDIPVLSIFKHTWNLDNNSLERNDMYVEEKEVLLMINMF